MDGYVLDGKFSRKSTSRLHATYFFSGYSIVGSSGSRVDAHATDELPSIPTVSQFTHSIDKPLKKV